MPDVLAFLRRGPISPRLHGTLDYPLAAALIAGPLLLDLDSERVFVFILILGGAATLLAVATDWSRGIIHVIPPVVHGILDVAATVALIIAPFVLFYSEHALALWFSVGVGLGGLIATLLTRFESDLQPAMTRAGMEPAL